MPDPASRFQPEDVHGPSEVIDPAAYRWPDESWRGRPWHEAVLYELHVGAFTPEGTFRAAIGRLDHLASLGVTAIEIMPVGDFPGRRNWGYDGVLPYAPDSTYGRPEDLKALVEAAHQRGLMVLLDVVYNHFGPDGNYLSTYAPDSSPTGTRRPGATPSITTASMRSRCASSSSRTRSTGSRSSISTGCGSTPSTRSWTTARSTCWTNWPNACAPRPRTVRFIWSWRTRRTRPEGSRARADGKPLRYTAQWNDDVHHVLHAAATGETKGYYAEYVGDTEKLGRALAEGFAFQGEMMAYRGRTAWRAQRRSAAHRLHRLHPKPRPGRQPRLRRSDHRHRRAEAVRAIAAVYLLLPQIPMLFMGEEWAASQPFPFFCDFGGELADAVREGRREEFAKFPEFQDAEIARAHSRPAGRGDLRVGQARLGR